MLHCVERSFNTGGLLVLVLVLMLVCPLPSVAALS